VQTHSWCVSACGQGERDNIDEGQSGNSDQGNKENGCNHGVTTEACSVCT
jgi:hypothetical protein